jgi:hypothetical protein
MTTIRHYLPPAEGVDFSNPYSVPSIICGTMGRRWAREPTTKLVTCRHCRKILREARILVYQPRARRAA